MSSKKVDINLVVIVGPTASGKSSAAMEVARLFDGEIVCADSRTVYRGMDIGTAKPSHLDREEIPHHLLDIIDPSESFSAARFKQLANGAIQDILDRGRLPILVGGTGLYVDSVLFDYDFPDRSDGILRQRLETMSVEELQSEIAAKGLKLPENIKNKRHLSRVIEVNGRHGKRSTMMSNSLVVGINPGLEIISKNIDNRIEQMMSQGYLPELRELVTKFGWDAPGLQSTSYRAFRDYINGVATLDESIATFHRNDYQLARRQLTWFRRNKSIHWVNKQIEVVDFLTTILNKKQ